MEEKFCIDLRRRDTAGDTIYSYVWRDYVFMFSDPEDLINFCGFLQEIHETWEKPLENAGKVDDAGYANNLARYLDRDVDGIFATTRKPAGGFDVFLTYTPGRAYIFRYKAINGASYNFIFPAKYFVNRFVEELSEDNKHGKRS